jgi:hypothetical protein
MRASLYSVYGSDPQTEILTGFPNIGYLVSVDATIPASRRPSKKGIPMKGTLTVIFLGWMITVMGSAGCRSDNGSEPVDSESAAADNTDSGGDGDGDADADADADSDGIPGAGRPR